jgi:DNA polymerase III alpha subunit (gram-positive type)
MKHLKNNLMCVIDVETTPYEIWQVAVIPLNPAFEPIQGCTPFEVIIRPEHPEKCDRRIMRMKKDELERIKKARETHDTAVDLFHSYCRSAVQKYAGGEAKILPIGQNWAYDCGKLQMWLGDDAFEDMFHPCYRDPMVVAQFLNDVSFLDVEGLHKKAPFEFANLRYLTNKFSVVNHKAHDALQDSQATVKVYHEMVKMAAGDFTGMQETGLLFKWLFDLVNERNGLCLDG